MQLNTYLNFGGNCAEAFAFYETHLGGKMLFSMKWDEMPEPKNIPPGMEDQMAGKILHMSMTLGGMRLMGADTPNYQPMRSAYLSLHLDSDAEADRIYGILSDGGEIFMKMGETFYATRFAMLRDKFGTSWMIIHERPMN